MEQLKKVRRNIYGHTIRRSIELKITPNSIVQVIVQLPYAIVKLLVARRFKKILDRFRSIRRLGPIETEKSLTKLAGETMRRVVRIDIENVIICKPSIWQTGPVRDTQWLVRSAVSTKSVVGVENHRGRGILIVLCPVPVSFLWSVRLLN